MIRGILSFVNINYKNPKTFFLCQIQNFKNQYLATAYIHLQIDLKMLHFAPLAPQFWGEPEFTSPPELGDLGGFPGFIAFLIVMRYSSNNERTSYEYLTELP